MSNLSAAGFHGGYDDYDTHHDDRPTREPLGLAPEPVEIRRNGGLAVAIGAIASAVAIAYLARAIGSGAWLDWALVVVMGAIGTGYLLAFVDARTPLLVADDQGVRMRLGRSWRGLPWGEIERVEHEPRRGVLRDGRLRLVARDAGGVLADLDGSGRRQAALGQRLHGSPLAVPLSLSTRVSGAGGGLTAALERLAGDAERVVELAPAAEPDDALDGVDEPEARDEEVARPWTRETHETHETHAPLRTDETDEVAGTGAAAPTDEERDDEDVEPHHPVLHDPRPALARGIGFLADRLRRAPRAEDAEHAEDAETDSDSDERSTEVPETHEPTREQSPARPSVVASDTPPPLRATITGIRAEIRFEGGAALAPADSDPGDDAADPDGTDETQVRLPGSRQLRRPGSVDLVEDTVVWGDRVRPIARPGQPVAPLVIDDFPVEPAEDPVIGPELLASRTRLGLTVDQLADRTRIRPHVIESIEVDDFAPCGGDFYARGHLRTLARVLGIDAGPLLASYDDRYADAPIDARRVFEAELATGVDGPIRSTRGGPNWSVLVAAVMAVVLAWSIARLVMDSPVELAHKPVLNGSPSSTTKLGPPVPVVLTATSGGAAHVVVRGADGQIVFNGDVPGGHAKKLKASPPVRVQSSDGGLRVSVDGQDRGALGADGQPAQNSFSVAD